MPTAESRVGSSIAARGSAGFSPAPLPRPPRSVSKAFVNTSGLANRLTSEATTMIVIPHHSDQVLTTWIRL